MKAITRTTEWETSDGVKWTDRLEAEVHEKGLALVDVLGLAAESVNVDVLLLTPESVLPKLRKYVAAKKRLDERNASDGETVAEI